MYSMIFEVVSFLLGQENYRLHMLRKRKHIVWIRRFCNISMRAEYL